MHFTKINDTLINTHVALHLVHFCAQPNVHKNVRKKCERVFFFSVEIPDGSVIFAFVWQGGVVLSPIVISCYTRHMLSFPAQGPFVHDTFQAPAPKES